MKRFLFCLMAMVAIVGCTEAYDDTDIRTEINDLKGRVTALEKMCKEMNTNIASLQTIVGALQTNDYITNVSPIVQNGKTIGYTISFAKAQPITIYHGTDGKDGQDGQDGADGEDGKDSGYIPQIGVKQDVDGIYYWTLDGDWLLDENGNKVKAVGTDGKDGENGKDGVDGEDGKDGENGQDGTDGITPQLKIENDYWYISYDNGQTWTMLGKATGEDGQDGADGKDGESFFQSVTQDEHNVYFTLADGTVITVPKGTSLNITFAESDLVVMSPNSTREISYTVTSATETVTVEVTSSADVKAKVIADDDSGLTGKIRITTGATIDEYSKVIVFVSNDEKVIMRSITFEEAGLVVEEITTKIVAAEGGNVTLEFLSNVSYDVVIPEDAQSWISVVPATRAMEKHTVVLELQPNDGYYRSVTVTVQSPDGSLKLEYQVEQDGELGVNIDPTQIPDNEIWYTTTDGEIIPFHSLNLELGLGCENTNANLVSNTYSNGVGILRFDNTLTVVNHLFDSGAHTLQTIYFPNSLTELRFKNTIYGDSSFFDIPPLFHHCENLEYCYLPDSIERMGKVFFQCTMLQEIRIPNSLQELSSGLCEYCPNLHTIKGNHRGISEDGKTFVIDNTLFAFAPKNITSYTIEEGITSIAGGVFRFSQLRSIKFPDTLQSIGGSCFEGSSLESLSLTANVQHINGIAFSDCVNLRTVFIEESVQDIDFGYAVFSGCDNIEEFKGKYASKNNLFLIKDGQIIAVAKKTLESVSNLEIPEGISDIGPHTFYDLDNLESVKIGEGVVVIGDYAFGECNNLKTIYIPESAEYYGNGFLSDCPNLEAIYGPNTSLDNRYIVGRNLTTCGSVPPDLFYGWQDNTLVAFASKDIEEYTFEGDINGIGVDVFSCAQSLRSVTIKSPITHVLESAFSSCPVLTTVDLPESVELIGHDAFAGAEKLKELIIRAINPPYMPSEWLISSGLYNAEILVLNNKYCIEAYKREWPELASRIKGGIDVDYYISTDYSQDGVVTTLQTATKGAGIDVVLMGDAYSDRQIADGTYKTDMEYIYNNLLAEEPYKSFKDHFNVHYVNVVSATEGYDYGNTALSGYFGNGTQVGGNDSAVFNYALNAISEEEMDEALLIVAMNSDNYAGTCYMYYPQTSLGYGNGVSVAYFPKGGDQTTFAQLLHHEACGHGFAKLADEYAYEEMGAVSSDYVSQIQAQQTDWGWWKNVDFTSDISAVRWAEFISDSRYANEKLGAYEGAMTYWSGVWRPTENSIMHYNTGGFNAPSREAIYYRIHRLAYGDEWTYDYETFVKYDEINRTTTTTTQSVPMIYKPTAPPVVMQKNWRDELR